MQGEVGQAGEVAFDQAAVVGKAHIHGPCTGGLQVAKQPAGRASRGQGAFMLKSFQVVEWRSGSSVVTKVVRSRSSRIHAT